MLLGLGTLGAKARLGFDAAESGGRHADWETGTTSTADVLSRRQGGRLRARARDLARNDMLAQSALRILSVASYGVTPHADTGDPQLDRDIDALWREWSRQASTGSYHTIEGIQYLMLLEWMKSGGAMLRVRSRLPTDGLVVPLQVELVAIDHLVTEKDGDLQNGQGRIIQGIELDAFDRIAAYHLWKVNPKSGRAQPGMVRVPEGAICHLYDAEEIGQQRGVPWLSAAMVPIRDLQLLGDALRTRAVGESSFMGVVTTPRGQDDEPFTATGTTDVVDGTSVITEGFAPGQWASLKEGEDIKFHSPTGTSFDAMRRSEIQQIASNAGVTYEQVSGDLSQTNWTSYKAGQVPHRALVRWVQTELLIPLVMRRIWVWWLDAAVHAELLPESVRGRLVQIRGGGAYRREYPVRWELPPFEEVDREAEAKATVVKIRNGLSSWEYEVEREGHNPEDVLASLERTQNSLKARGLVLDCMPAMATTSGQVQQAPAAPAEDKPRNAKP